MFSYMKSLIPKSWFDRSMLIGLLLVSLFIFSPLYNNNEFNATTMMFGLALGIVGATIAAFLFKRINGPDSQPASGDADGYAIVINKTSRIVKSLGELNDFLVAERAKIFEAEAAVRSLKEEKASLEPVVATTRETVAAILAAYNGTARRAVWKERLVGFILGTIASIMSSFLYELFKK